ncbi:hypothetical protein C3L33_09081, partial [Rhododendron williamsianum]
CSEANLGDNQKAREEGEKKQLEAEKLQKLNELDGDAGVDGDKKERSMMANKDEDDKMQATTANVAARTTVGGDDMLSKWLSRPDRNVKEGESMWLLVLSRAKKRVSSPHQTLQKNAKDIEGGEKRVLSLMVVLGIPKCFLVLLARYTWVVGGFG